MRTAISTIMTAQATGRLSILQNYLNDLTTTYLSSKSEMDHLSRRLEAVFGDSNLERGERAALYAGVKHYQDLMALDLAIMRGVHAQMEEIHANEKKRLAEEREKMGNTMMERARMSRQGTNMRVYKGE